MKARRQLFGLAVAATALAIALAGSAAATRTVRIGSHITIHSNSLHFTGHVGSSNAACKQGRKVTLFRVFSNGSHQAVGHDTTSGSGHWGITLSGSAGITLSHFFARVKRRSEGTAGTIFVCKGARSKTIPVSP